jgi:hypothetical protein
MFGLTLLIIGRSYRMQGVSDGRETANKWKKPAAGTSWGRKKSGAIIAIAPPG